MSPEGVKEEIKLHTEIIKFLMVVLIAAAGGMITLYNINQPTNIQNVLITLGWVFIPILLIGIVALFFFVCLFVIKENLIGYGII
jgi:hypothetical protein